MTDLMLLLAIFFIVFCLFVVLTERKFLAHAQRRFGPSIAGRNGWFQIILDLLKLMTKEFFIIPTAAGTLAPTLIALLFAVQLLFIQNFVFGPSLFFFFNLDGMIFYHLILVMVTNLLLLLLGFLTQSKYSLIGVFRSVVHVVSLDIYITVSYVLIVLTMSSGSFHDYAVTQWNSPLLFLLAPLAYLFLIIMLLEAKRAPFDHVETESEVVAGYATEYSGIYLLTFYLVEYFHLIISANHFVILFTGAWFKWDFWVALPQVVAPALYNVL